MSQYKFNPQHLYENTNHGLDIIFKYIPEAVGSEQNKKMFKFRDERSASASLTKKADCWVVNDFGDKGYSPIEICRYFTGYSFIEALKFLYAEFNISVGENFFKPNTDFEDTDKEIGIFDILENEDFKDIDLVGRFLNEKTALEYGFISVKEYSFTFKNKKTDRATLCKITATEQFPIFAYQFEEWAKIYQPLDSKFKHSYVGKKPQRHVFGLERLKNIYKETIDNFNSDIEEATKNKDEYLVAKITKERDEFKIESVIICSGGSDGLNVASLGYNVIWFNSESEQLNWSEYKELKKICHTIYNLPDIDTAGTKYGYQVAEMFWNLKTIWLPESLKAHKGKDFRDWLKKYPKSDENAIKFQFKNLLAGALQMKFFTFNPKSKKYAIRPSYLHYYLKIKGFYVYYLDRKNIEKSTVLPFVFIRITDHIVEHFNHVKIRKFVERDLIEKGQPTEVIDMIKSTIQFTENNLLSIDSIELDFKAHTENSQTFFFKNQFATITPDGIEYKNYREYKNYVWRENILDATIQKNDKPYFEPYKDNKGNDRVKILRTDCQYMNFLINGSRMYWRKELELPFEHNSEEKKAYHDKNRFNLSAETLNENERIIQEQHFLNKCFGIGYVLHRHKVDSFAKLVYVMDDVPKESEDDSNGRSGKSLMFNGVDRLLPRRFKIDGKGKSIMTDKHILQGFSNQSDYLRIEDIDQYMPMEFFYNWVTDSIPVNPKNATPFEVPFSEAGKLVVTSNFGISKVNQSTLGRLFFVSFSDYYHVKTDKYLEERKVNADFDFKDLFSSAWTDTDWNNFYNFLLYCGQIYMQYRNAEFNAPLNNINLNNFKASIGDNFMSWCENYFTESQFDEVLQEAIQGTLDEPILRKEMQKNYVDFVGQKSAKSATAFKKALNDYCKMKGWALNPKDMQGSDGTIKHPVVDANGKRQILEHFYISTSAFERIKTVSQPKPKTEVQTEMNLDTNVDF